MDYRLVVVVVACIALAGCSLGGNAGPGAETPSLDSVPYPDGYDRNGTTSPSAVVSGHQASLLTAPNYSVRWGVHTQQNGSTVQNVSVQGSVSPANNRSLIRLAQHGPDGEIDGYHREAYYGDGRQRVYSLANETQTAQASLNFSQLVPLYPNRIAQVHGVVNLTASGVERRGNDSVITYDVTGVAAAASEQLESASGNVRVTEDGRLVALDVTIASGAAEQAFRYSITGVGNSTVDRPDWIDAAGNATAN